MQGVGFRPYVYRLAASWAGRLRAERRARSAGRGGGRPGGASSASWRACPPRRRRWPGRARRRRGRSQPTASAGSRSLESERGGEPDARGRRPTPPPATTACASSSTPPTAATATRSSTAPTAARASRSCAACPTTGRSPPWPAFAMCAALPGRVRRPRRPPLPRPAERLPRLRAAAALLGGVAPAGRRPAAPRRPRRCSPGRSWRSRASAATTWPASRRRRSGRGGAARPQAPRGQAVRADGARRWRPPARSCEPRPRPSGAAGGSRAPDRDRRRRRRARAVADAVAPGSRDLGVMLPYTPLHHLLLADVGAHAGDDERQRLRRADRLRGRGRARAARRHRRPRSCVHDRPIHMRTDDSVVRAVGAAGRCCCAARAATCPRACALPVAARRRRCWPAAPSSRAPSAWPRARGAWVGHHIGDLRELRDAAARSARGSSTSSACSPSRPRWSRTTCTPTTSRPRYALEREGVELVGVQHHHAHLAACLAEHGRRGPAVGAIYDGTGYGHRRHGRGAASCWSATSRASSAPGSCWPVRLPGGDRAAVREPWRMACAWLVDACRAEPSRRRRSPAEVDGRHAGAPWPSLPRRAGRRR